jgi:hypothetical protein
MPIIAEPASFMTVRMSAKSRLIRPGMVIRSVTPWMPWRSVSSAMRKASSMLVFFSTISSRRSFGMTISVSTFWDSSSMPCSAWLRRRRPSKLNGFVTIPTVSAPISSRAISATTGAAPVPVPPPSPAVTNTISDSASDLCDLVAAFLGCLSADLGVRAGTQAARKILADMNGLVCIGHQQRLVVGVDGDELNALDAGLDHAVDCICAAAADTHDADEGVVVGTDLICH